MLALPVLEQPNESIPGAENPFDALRHSVAGLMRARDDGGVSCFWGGLEAARELRGLPPGRSSARAMPSRQKERPVATGRGYRPASSHRDDSREMKLDDAKQKARELHPIRSGQISDFASHQARPKNRRTALCVACCVASKWSVSA